VISLLVFWVFFWITKIFGSSLLCFSFWADPSDETKKNVHQRQRLLQTKGNRMKRKGNQLKTKRQYTDEKKKKNPGKSREMDKNHVEQSEDKPNDFCE
jgi:hypothetical protein